MNKIVLKSTSPRRKELLEKMGYDFIIKSFDVSELIDNNLTPEENVKRISLNKALAKKELFKDYIQIGCDTIVVLDNKIYGKPKDLKDARCMLELFSGKMHQVMSGLCVIYNDKIYNEVIISNVYFKKLSDKDIDDYLATKESLGKAGAYAIQGIGAKLVEKYEGSLNNIIGLPTERLEEIIGEINGMEN